MLSETVYEEQLFLGKDFSFLYIPNQAVLWGGNMRYLYFLLVLAACSKAPAPKATPIPVTAVRVDPQTVPANFEFVGVGESSHIVQLRARVEGYLESIDYVEGGLVQDGQLMFVLDQRPFIAQVDHAQGELAHQKAVLWNAQQSLNRMLPLYQQNAVSQKDLDNAVAEELGAKADVEKAEASLYEAELNLSFASVTAPVKGLASQAKYREGALIAPGPGDQNLLTTIYVVDPIWVNFNVSDNDLLKLRKDIKDKRIVIPAHNQFRIEAILSDGTVVPAEGTIDFMNPAIEQNTGTMLIRAVLPNANIAIYPGLFVKVRVIGAVRPNAMLVPQTAVMQGATGTFVYVIQDGKAVMRPVVPGDWYKDYWIIDQGLNPGDIVISVGGNRVQQGTKVTIQSMVKSGP